MDPRQRLMMQLQHADEVNYGSGKQPIPLSPLDFSNQRQMGGPAWGYDIPRPVDDKPLEPEDPIGSVAMGVPLVRQGIASAMQFAGRQGSRAGLGMQRAMSSLGESMENSELQAAHAAGTNPALVEQAEDSVLRAIHGAKVRPDPFRPGARMAPPEFSHLENGDNLGNEVVANMPQPQWQAFHQRASSAVGTAPVPSTPSDIHISVDQLKNMGDDTLNAVLRGQRPVPAGNLTANGRGPLLGGRPAPPEVPASTSAKWDALEQHLNGGARESSISTGQPPAMGYGDTNLRQHLASRPAPGDPSVFTGNPMNAPMWPGQMSRATSPWKVDPSAVTNPAFQSRVKTMNTVVSPGVPTITRYR